MPSLKVISLGCSKNTVDTEVILGNVLHRHWKIIPSESVRNPDVLLINTCGFILDAKQESVDMILQASLLKVSGKIKKLYVMGCLVKRHQTELEKEIREVDAWFGVNNVAEVIRAILQENADIDLHSRNLTTPKHYAYLKIAEGCDRKCSYCAIPNIRGPYISRSIEDIVEEARLLVAQGVKELILIAQDVTFYGMDLYRERKLVDLLKALLKIEKLKWIRLQYLYPFDFPMELLDLMEREPRICRYIDLPIQHIATPVLHSMKRHITEEKTRDLLSEIRTRVPGVAMRTTCIVGYPTETAADFAALKNFIQEFRFDRMGVFTYSQEEGTPAYELGDTVSEEEKQRRADELMEIQEQVSYQMNLSRIGKVYAVLIDREEGDYYVGRTEFDSPEVDDEVLIARDSKLKIGEFYSCKVVEADVHDIYAEVVG